MVVPLIGYMDRFSARPGERLAVKVSSQLEGSYQAELVRVRHADPNPVGPGMKLLPVAADWAGRYPSRAQRVPRAPSARRPAPWRWARPSPCWSASRRGC